MNYFPPNNITDIAKYLADARYLFLAKIEIYDFDINATRYVRKIVPANTFTEAILLLETEFDEEMNSINLECLDTCFTFDEETFEKFRKDTMPIETLN